MAEITIGYILERAMVYFGQGEMKECPLLRDEVRLGQKADLKLVCFKIYGGLTPRIVTGCFPDGMGVTCNVAGCEIRTGDRLTWWKYPVYGDGSLGIKTRI